MKAVLSQWILGYLKFWAKLRLRQNNPVIIGITGSAGKTSALLACQAVLASNTALKVSHKANSESGIPLNVLNLKPRNFSILDWMRLCLLAPFAALFGDEVYETYLVELGIDSPDSPKNMSYLLTIVQPQVGIYLGASAVHAENFDHLVSASAENRLEKIIAKIAAEKGKLISSLPKSGTAIINLDDPHATELMEKSRAEIITFGTNPDSTIRLIKTNWTKKSTIFAFEIDKKRYQLQLHNYLVPDVFGLTLAAAIACGISQDLSVTESITALETKLTLPPGRSSVLAGINDSLILDSSYNASTKPTLSMLEMLKNIPAQRHLSLLGDMREMGALTAQEHQTVALKAAQVCDKIYLVGPLMREFALPILEQKKCPVAWFPTTQAAGKALQTELENDDLLLVKGSQNTILLETAVESLLANPEDAAKLCRRGTFWDAQRAKLE
ncbi:MAG: Mur ligase family protein [Patescibacteria group bacterium]